MVKSTEDKKRERENVEEFSIFDLNKKTREQTVSKLFVSSGQAIV